MLRSLAPIIMYVQRFPGDLDIGGRKRIQRKGLFVYMFFLLDAGNDRDIDRIGKTEVVRNRDPDPDPDPDPGRVLGLTLIIADILIINLQ